MLLAAFWLCQRCRVPVVMLAIAAGFSLLAYLLTVVIFGAVVHAVRIRGVVGSALVVITQLGLTTLVVLAYRRSLLFLPLAVLAGFALSASQRALLMVHSSTWPLVVCWAAAAMALVVLMHRSGWLKIAPQDETAQMSVTTVRSVG